MAPYSVQFKQLSDTDVPTQTLIRIHQRSIRAPHCQAKQLTNEAAGPLDVVNTLKQSAPITFASSKSTEVQ